MFPLLNGIIKTNRENTTAPCEINCHSNLILLLLTSGTATPRLFSKWFNDYVHFFLRFRNPFQEFGIKIIKTLFMSQSVDAASFRRNLTFSAAKTPGNLFTKFCGMFRDRIAWRIIAYLAQQVKVIFIIFQCGHISNRPICPS